MARANCMWHPSGVVFASYCDQVEPFQDYLGRDLARVRSDVRWAAAQAARPLSPYAAGNWKLYHENLRDPYHATLLHTFLVTFD